jgi:uncharacterized coiled-coil protein SlyX
MPAKNHADFNPETRLALLEQTTDHIYETLIRMEKRFDKIDEKFDKIDEKLNRLENKFDGKIERLSAKVDFNFYTLLTIYLGGYAGMFAIMAKGFHWY